MNQYHLKIKAKSILQKSLGKRFIDNIFLSYYLRIAKQRGIFFFHIPKSAGTSICQELYGRRIGHFSYNKICALKGESVFKGLETFTVVRNPLARIYSAYKFVYYGSGLGAVKDQNFYQKNPRFRNFDTFVQEWLVNQDLNKIDLIFKPQHQFVCNDKSQVNVDHVFFIEEPQEIETYLSDHLKKNVKLSNLNKSYMKFAENYASDESELIIKRLYAKDFEIFGY